MTKDEKRRDLIKNQDWGNTPLKDYLRYDRWKERGAWFILVGYEGNPETKGKHPILAPENDFNEDIDYEKMSPEGKINFKRLEAFWKNTDNYRRENGRPQQYIDWALSKGIRPLWLDWAIEQKIYIPKIPKQGVNTVLSDSADNKKTYHFNKESSDYPIELDLACQAWKSVSSADKKGTPKKRIKKWLDDNTKLSDAAKSRIAIVANWKKLGGATPT